MSDWLDFDLDKTVHDFEYTRRATVKMNRIIDSGEFEEMDAEMIFDYLAGEMDIVLFPDYLKRYIYEKLDLEIPFKEVSQNDYLEIISSSFSDNNAPYSFTPTTTKKNAMIKLWLTQPGAKRSVVFTLGFGLRMTAEEVSEFLTKVLKEEDFDFTDPEEVIYWYCYKNDLPYAAADSLLKQYGQMQSGTVSEKKWEAMRASPEIWLLSEQNLLLYLSMLKSRGESEDRKNTAYLEFEKLYEQCCAVIADMYNEEEAVAEQKKQWDADMIRPADLEKVLCSGIPVNGKNNLEAASASRLGKLFQNKRMSRQRISGILNRKHPAERFDLITLLFFIYAQTVEPDWPAERYLQYIDAVNELLQKCQMMGIYPANPYEAFVLMCIVTEFPLDVYAQVWEKSYENG